ncbi:MAG: short-chain dehydrogenase, partial [Candidatus Kapaibacterium sp.]
FKSGINVVTIKPGFVDTPMTAHVPKNVLFATPQRVARDIVRAMDKGSDMVYVPGFWRYVMLIIRHIPERIFKRLGL